MTLFEVPEIVGLWPSRACEVPTGQFTVAELPLIREQGGGLSLDTES